MQNLALFLAVAAVAAGLLQSFLPQTKPAYSSISALSFVCLRLQWPCRAGGSLLDLVVATWDVNLLAEVCVLLLAGLPLEEPRESL